jgi:hypothetical protein
MPREDDMHVTPVGMDRADEVGMVHGRYGDDIGIIDVEPPKPTPRWLLKLRALVRRGEHSGARPQ